MSIFAKLAFKNLKQNKNRTLITVIGIILSTAMICGLISLLSSFQRYFYENTVAKTGVWDVMYDSLSDEQAESIMNDNSVQTNLKLQNIGYAEVENYNDFKPYLFVAGLPQNYETASGAQQLFPVYLKEGHYPASSEEIILPYHFLTRAEEEYKLGDKMTLDIGQRTLVNDDFLAENEESQATEAAEDGAGLTQFIPLNTDENSKSIEKIENTVTKSYTIVGFYERSDNESYEAPGYMALTKADDSVKESRNTYFLKLKNSKDSFDFLYKYQPEAYFQANNEALRYLGISTNDGFNATMYSIGALFMIIIMIASITLISNAFNITLAERVKQFGILASVGASKKQLRKSILIEALFICIIALPFGIAAGLLGIKLTLLYIQQIFANISDEFMGRVPISLHVSWIGIALSVVITLITVLISAYRPALKASRISPVEAIRQSKEITARPVKVSRLNQKLFGTSGFIATKYYKHSKRKYRSTVFSLMISIILFITAFTFTKTMTNSVNSIFHSTDADISLHLNSYSSPRNHSFDLSEIQQDLNRTEGVTSTKKLVQSMPDIILEQDKITNEALKLSGSQEIYLQNIDSNKFLTSINVVFLDEADFTEILSAANISPENYQVKNGEKYQPIVYNQQTVQNMQRKYIEYSLFEENTDVSLHQIKEIPNYIFSYLEQQNGTAMAVYTSNDEIDGKKNIPLDEAIEKNIDFHLQYFTNEYPSMMMDLPSITWFLPMEVRDELNLKDSFTQEYLLINTLEEKHQEVVKFLDQYTLKFDGFLNFVDFYDMQKSNEGLIKMLNVFCYGFIVLISLIALTNVFNTITTNISLRKRDFAMLKSVGMSSKGFRGIAIFECILYGTRSLLFGIPLAIGVSFLIQKSIGETYQTAYFIPWNALGISVIVIFVFVAISMFYAMSKMRKMNIIETLKNDLM